MCAHGILGLSILKLFIMDVSASSITQPIAQSLPSALLMFKNAWRNYRDHWQLFLGIMVIPVLLALPYTLFGEQFVLFSFLSALALVVARPALFDAVVENGEPAGGIRGAYRKGLSFFVPFLWVSLLVSLVVFGGFFLFIVPGILLSIWLSFSLYPLFAEGRHGISALTTSWHYVKGYWGQVFWRFIVFGICIFLIAIPFLILSGLIDFIGGSVRAPLTRLVNLVFTNFFVLPIGIIYTYILYQSLKQLKAQQPPEAEEAKLRTPIIIFAVLGVVGIILIFVLAGFLLAKFGEEFFKAIQSAETLPVRPSSLLASMGFSPLIDFAHFWR